MLCAGQGLPSLPLCPFVPAGGRGDAPHPEGVRLPLCTPWGHLRQGQRGAAHFLPQGPGEAGLLRQRLIRHPAPSGGGQLLRAWHLPASTATVCPAPRGVARGAQCPAPQPAGTSVPLRSGSETKLEKSTPLHNPFQVPAGKFLCSIVPAHKLTALSGCGVGAAFPQAPQALQGGAAVWHPSSIVGPSCHALSTRRSKLRVGWKDTSLLHTGASGLCC